MNRIARFLREESATTSVEYAVMLALILLVCFAAISSFGTGQGGKWASIDSQLDAVGF